MPSQLTFWNPKLGVWLRWCSLSMLVQLGDLWGSSRSFFQGGYPGHNPCNTDQPKAASSFCLETQSRLSKHREERHGRHVFENVFQYTLPETNSQTTPLKIARCPKRNFHIFHLLIFRSYCWWKKSCTSWYGKYPIICKVLAPSQLLIAGFQPSTIR